MYRVMNFDAAVRKLLDNKNMDGYLKYSSELLILGICKEDFPEGAEVERLEEGILTKVNAWYVPNECFREEMCKEISEENDEREVNFKECVSALEEAAALLNRPSCVGIHCGECPLNMGSEYGARCIVPIINGMCVKEGV